MPDNPDQTTPKKRRKGVPWRKDLLILQRLPRVETLHLGGKTNVAIATELGVDEQTIRADIKRLQELWQERIQEESHVLRAQVAAELQDLKVRALDAAAWDALCERAVLFGGQFTLADGTTVWVHRDDKGSAQFRGNKAASLNVARQAVMDKAKVLGVVVDKQALTTGEGEDIPLAELMERFARARDRERAADAGGAG